MAIAVKENQATLDNVKQILNTTFNELDFSNLIAVKFVGDGTYFEFTDKFIEIRPSGTDAKTKAYSGGKNKEEIEKYASTMGNYSGERNEIHKQIISNEIYSIAKDKSMEYYLKFVEKNANDKAFEIPIYKFLML